MSTESFAIAVKDIKLTYPPPFWLYGTRWKERPYKGVFRAHYAPKFSPLEMARSKKGKISYGSYRRPIEAPWTDKKMHDRMREGVFDEAVPNPLKKEDSALLFKLESKHENPFDDGTNDLQVAEQLLGLYQKIEKSLVLLFYRVAPKEGTKPAPQGFRFLGYDYGEFGGDRSSRVFDLLFQEWAETADEREFVRDWRRRLNENGLFDDLCMAQRWQAALEQKPPHPSCCRGGEILEVYELQSRPGTIAA
jgi:hypothetical protein